VDSDVIEPISFRCKSETSHRSKNAKHRNSPSLFLFRIYKRDPASVSFPPHHHPYRYSMASLALDFDSPNFEYFPPTPSPSDDESELKPTTVKPPTMSSVAPDSLPTNGGAAPRSAKVTLHLGHLPSKKDIKGPWPRTPTRVSSSLLHTMVH
jgi:hypothetical protein